MASVDASRIIRTVHSCRIHCWPILAACRLHRDRGSSNGSLPLLISVERAFDITSSAAHGSTAGTSHRSLWCHWYLIDRTSGPHGLRGSVPHAVPILIGWRPRGCRHRQWALSAGAGRTTPFIRIGSGPRWGSGGHESPASKDLGRGTGWGSQTTQDQACGCHPDPFRQDSAEECSRLHDSNPFLFFMTDVADYGRLTIAGGLTLSHLRLRLRSR